MFVTEDPKKVIIRSLIDSIRLGGIEIEMFVTEDPKKVIIRSLIDSIRLDGSIKMIITTATKQFEILPKGISQQ